MHRNNTGKDPVYSTAPPASETRSFPFHLPRSLRHVRVLLRVAQRRHSLALGLGMASALSALAATTALHVVHSAHTLAAVAPLAPPAPPPISPPAKTRHRKLLGNPLRGIASWYGDVWQGRRTASGEIFDDTQMTACHKTLPFGTVVRVTDVRTSKSVVVKINDRGTLFPGRIIDLSSGAANKLGILRHGLANVRVDVVGKAPIRAAPVEVAQARPAEPVIADR